ncbi:uncharacterized protein LOC116340895 isoform X1 [Contarinia nasturtii]|uniref:uncharacterized protein LOC116340895 isoform X1 n=1 Tax=Contarinia nasturtii TaxID=265458 RepID=UPI0012D37412|nr:uncharacterized protein LOC116340895 isoform X1 [Contarinia nasturtii]XP_031623494.1 uncharacterized protein LOC116340895 isoform X1 [Contarinia nasturtii]
MFTRQLLSRTFQREVGLVHLKKNKKWVAVIHHTYREMENKPKYDIVLGQESLNNIVSYKNDLCTNKIAPGTNLMGVLNASQSQLNQMTTEEFVTLLLLTKKPMIFAGDANKDGGCDWNELELQILGDLGIAMNVEIYDNGVWSPRNSSFCTHNPPLNGTLLFIPGALLEQVSPDLKEVTSGNNIDQDKYNRLIERRLMPLLYYANEKAKQENVRALITCPAVGCGAFAGRFRGQMGEHLNQALQYILTKHAHNFDNIACVFFGPHSECSNESHQFENVKYRIRPELQNPNKSQLCNPKQYEESGDNFSNCKLFKIVAWDHLSFPGNLYFVGSRNTDDGVSAAATNSMQIITGIKGRYDRGHYLPPEGYDDWEQVVEKNKITLLARNNVKIITANGSLIDLKV